MLISWQSFVLHFINLIVLYVFLRILLYKPVADFMHHRKERYVFEIQRIAAEKEELAHKEMLIKEKLDDVREKVLKIGEEAESAAHLRAEAIIEDAKKIAEAYLLQARNEFEEEKRRMIDNLHADSVNFALDIAKKIVTREFTNEYNHDFIQQMIKGEQTDG